MWWSELIQRLGDNADVIAALGRGVGEVQGRWRPEEGQWSFVEVLNHLADEEVEDFRTRLRMTLEHPEREWQPIDPEGWAAERAYRSRNVEESLQRFLTNREESIAWLTTLRDPDWTACHVREGGERITAGDLLASWVGHDFIHIRQLNRLHRQYLLHSVLDFSPDYAGSW